VIRTLVAEAIIAAQRMVWTLLAELIVITVGTGRVIWLLLAGETRGIQLAAKMMP
jgi:hypothetical protein